MNLVEIQDFDYASLVSVERPGGEFDASGNYEEAFVTVIDEMTADIQLSLQERTLTSEDATGTGDNAVWMMYCLPPEPVRAGDRVLDGDRTFMVEAVGEWGSHTECVMKRVNR